MVFDDTAIEKKKKLKFSHYQGQRTRLLFLAYLSKHWNTLELNGARSQVAFKRDVTKAKINIDAVDVQLLSHLAKGQALLALVALFFCQYHYVCTSKQED